MTALAWTLQTALYAVLGEALADAGPGGAAVPVYDAVPEGAAFPYVTIGDDVVTDGPYLDLESEDVTATVHVWSQYAGRREVKLIAGRIKAALCGQPLDVPEVEHVRFESLTVIEEPGGAVRHGALVFTILLAA